MYIKRRNFFFAAFKWSSPLPSTIYAIDNSYVT